MMFAPSLQSISPKSTFADFQTRASQTRDWGINAMNSRGAYARKIRGSDTRNILGKTDVAALCRETIREAYGQSKCIAKEVAEDSGQSPKAAENWAAGENPMGLTAFVNAYRNNPAFKAWAKKILLQEEDHDPEFQAHLAVFIDAVRRT